MPTEREAKPKNRKGYWTELLPTGERVLCFRARSDGKKTVVRLTLATIEKELKPNLQRKDDL